MPAILFGSAVSSVYFISQMLYARFGSNLLVRFFGTRAPWTLAMLLSPVRSL